MPYNQTPQIHRDAYLGRCGVGGGNPSQGTSVGVISPAVARRVAVEGAFTDFRRHASGGEDVPALTTGTVASERAPQDLEGGTYLFIYRFAATGNGVFVEAAVNYGRCRKSFGRGICHTGL